MNLDHDLDLRNREINERLDRIAQHLGENGASAETLNALHACRPGHPLNKSTKQPFSNFAFMNYGRGYRLPSVDLDWLLDMVKQEIDNSTEWRAVETSNIAAGLPLFMVTSPDGKVYRGRAMDEDDAIAQAKVRHEQGDRE